jgi:hypothetical protein
VPASVLIVSAIFVFRAEVNRRDAEDTEITQRTAKVHQYLSGYFNRSCKGRGKIGHIMPLYTFVLDYRGGTYVRQVRAPSPDMAPGIWAKTLNHKQITGLGPQSYQRLLKDMTNPETHGAPTKLRRMKNTWCCSSLLRKELALIHFVQVKE